MSELLDKITRETIDCIIDWNNFVLGNRVSRNEIVDVEAVEVTDDEDGNTDNH